MTGKHILQGIHSLQSAPQGPDADHEPELDALETHSSTPQLRIEEMLLESGIENSASLSESLMELQALAMSDAPEPGPELAALFAPQVSSLGERRWKKRHRTAIISATVIGAMGLGVGAVAAANEDFRESVGQTVGTLFQPSRPGPQDTPAGSENSPSPSHIPAVLPTGANAGDPSLAPVPEDAAGHGAAVNPSSDASRGLPLQPIDAAQGEGTVLEDKTLPPLPSPAKPTLPGLSSATPGKIGE